MEYSLYEYYDKKCSDLHEVREHFLEQFYYQDHSKKDERKLLRTIVSSSKINKLLREWDSEEATPNCRELLKTIYSLWRLRFRHKETIVLAVIDTALRWDIETNDEQKLCTPQELKEKIIGIFKYYYANEVIQDRKKSPGYQYVPDMPTWSLATFSESFGKLRVREYTNSMTGEPFKTCVFTKYNKRTFVPFSSKLGELTESEIEEMKDSLVVVQIPSGKYRLAKRGDWGY